MHIRTWLVGIAMGLDSTREVRRGCGNWREAPGKQIGSGKTETSHFSFAVLITFPRFQLELAQKRQKTLSRVEAARGRGSKQSEISCFSKQPVLLLRPTSPNFCFFLLCLEAASTWPASTFALLLMMMLARQLGRAPGYAPGP